MASVCGCACKPIPMGFAHGDQTARRKQTGCRRERRATEAMAFTVNAETAGRQAFQSCQHELEATGR